MVPGITHILKKNYTEHCLKNTLQTQELTDIILCVILIHIRSNSHHMLMTVASVVVKQHHIIQQQKKYIH